MIKEIQDGFYRGIVKRIEELVGISFTLESQESKKNNHLSFLILNIQEN